MKRLNKILCVIYSFLLVSCSFPGPIIKSGIEVEFLSCDDCSHSILDVNFNSNIDTYTIYENNDYFFSIKLFENDEEKEIDSIEFIKESSITLREKSKEDLYTYVVNCKSVGEDNKLTINIGEYSKTINFNVIENNNLSFSKEAWDNASNYEKSNLISASFKENEVEGMHCDDIKALLGEPDIETYLQLESYPPQYEGGKYVYNLGDYLDESYYLRIDINRTYRVSGYVLAYCSSTDDKSTTETRPTCLEEGLILQRCITCAKVLWEQKVNKVDCSFDENNVCKWCGFYKHDENLDKKEHILVVENYKEPTCLEDGYIIYGCSSCDDSVNYEKHYDKYLCSFDENDLCIWCKGQKPTVKYFSLHAGYYSEEWANVINSKNELEELLSTRLYDDEYIKEIYNYDEEYFSTKSLVVMLLDERNRNELCFEVTKAEVLDGEVNVSILSGIGTDPYPFEGNWIVAIELDDKISSDYQVNIIKKNKIKFM